MVLGMAVPANENRGSPWDMHSPQDSWYFHYILLRYGLYAQVPKADWLKVTGCDPSQLLHSSLQSHPDRPLCVSSSPPSTRHPLEVQGVLLTYMPWAHGCCCKLHLIVQFLIFGSLAGASTSLESLPWLPIPIDLGSPRTSTIPLTALSTLPLNCQHPCLPLLLGSESRNHVLTPFVSPELSRISNSASTLCGGWRYEYLRHEGTHEWLN